MQPELFPQSPIAITPQSGQTEPRLWVRRLVIWHKPEEIVRDISLGPGLNIIWSPDPSQLKDKNQDAPIGHGSGKTTFCRLLRYCLGEDSFAPDGQRVAIWTHFPEGHVGAEIILEGKLWVVLRSLSNRRRDIVIEDGTFAGAFRTDTAATGMAPLRQAITGAIIASAAKLMPSAVGENGAWEAALAWMTRDQECRFGKPLEWRDPDSKSHSPVINCSNNDLTNIVRAFIGALSGDELSVQNKESAEENNLRKFQAQFSHLEWQSERMRTELSAIFGANQTSGSPLDTAGLKAAANAQLANALNPSADISATDLESVRQKRETARIALGDLEIELKETATRLDEKRKTLILIKSQLPEESAKLIKEGNPVCPICEVPIDKARAEGCSISTATCDLNALQARVRKLRDDIQKEENEIAELDKKTPILKQNIALAKQRLDPLDKAVANLENALFERSQAVRSAERNLDNAERYEALLLEKAKTLSRVDETTVSLKKIRDTLTEYRASVVETIRELSNRFDSTIRELIPGEIKGMVKLDGNGLTLKVEYGGDRSTAAIESLKVVAFDLAVLTLAIEGKVFLPSFLLHDSPREADLGGSIYSRLFDLANKLEKIGPKPLFQYIVTTTTAPPDEFCTDRWLRLTIKGAPANERLLKIDL